MFEQKIVHSSHYCQVDPNKKVEVGSFRLSGDGNQNGRKLVSFHWRQLAQNLVSVSFRFHTRAPTSTYQRWWTRCARTSKTTRRPPPRPVGTQPSSGLGLLDPGFGPGWLFFLGWWLLRAIWTPRWARWTLCPTTTSTPGWSSMWATTQILLPHHTTSLQLMPDLSISVRKHSGGSGGSHSWNVCYRGTRHGHWTLFQKVQRTAHQFLRVYIFVFRTKICPAVEPPPEEYEFEKDEL